MVDELIKCIITISCGIILCVIEKKIAQCFWSPLLQGAGIICMLFSIVVMLVGIAGAMNISIGMLEKRINELAAESGNEGESQSFDRNDINEKNIYEKKAVTLTRRRSKSTDHAVEKSVGSANEYPWFNEILAGIIGSIIFTVLSFFFSLVYGKYKEKNKILPKNG